MTTLDDLRDELRRALCGPRCSGHEAAVERLVSLIERREARLAKRAGPTEPTPVPRRIAEKVQRAIANETHRAAQLGWSGREVANSVMDVDLDAALKEN